MANRTCLLSFSLLSRKKNANEAEKRNWNMLNHDLKDRRLVFLAGWSFPFLEILLPENKVLFIKIPCLSR